MKLVRMLWLSTIACSACAGARGSTSSEPITAEPLPPAPSAQPARSDGELVIGEDACQTDADCVPAECCHAAACVARAHAPECANTMCTEDCRFGTLDCGGQCLCHEGHCAAQLSRMPELPAR